MSSPEHTKIRYERLLQVFNRALSQSILKFQDWNKISSCFPHYAETELGKIHLENCGRQVSSLWGELCEREFQEIVKDRDVKSKLDELDELIAQAKQRLEDKQVIKLNSRSNLKLNRRLERKPVAGIDGKVTLETQGATTTPISIADLSVEQIVDCNLHNQRKSAIQELDERIKILDAMNQKLETKLSQFEDELKQETQELNDFYEEYLAQSTKADPDKTLVQGLNDMLSTLRDIP